MKKTILMVEDTDPLAEGLKERLELKRFNVHLEKDAEIGLRYAFKEKPSLILLDLNTNGDQFMKKLREDSWGKRSLVIILTSLSESKGMSLVSEFRPNQYFVKSSTKLDDLVEYIEELFA